MQFTPFRMKKGLPNTSYFLGSLQSFAIHDALRTGRTEELALFTALDW